MDVINLAHVGNPSTLNQEDLQIRTSLSNTVTSCLEKKQNTDVVEHVFNPSRQKQRQADLCGFNSSPVYMASSKPARAT